MGSDNLSSPTTESERTGVYLNILTYLLERIHLHQNSHAKIKTLKSGNSEVHNPQYGEKKFIRSLRKLFKLASKDK